MATIGTLSGVETISQIWPQSRPMISRPSMNSLSFTLYFDDQFQRRRQTGMSVLPHAAGLHDYRLGTLGVLDFGFEHDRGRAGDAAVFSDTPEMDAHENGSHERNGDAMPNVGAEERVGVHDGAAEEGEADVVERRHAELAAEGAFVS